MKKRRWHIAFFLIILATVFFNTFSNAQQLKLGNYPTRMEPSAVLHLESANQGLLLTRVADTEKINVLNPPDGMIIYYTDGATTFPYGFNAGAYQRKDGRWQKLGLRIDTAVDRDVHTIKFTWEEGRMVLHIPNATTGKRGVVSGGRQTFSGRKTFNDSVKIKNLHPGSVIFIRDDNNPNNNVLTENNSHLFWDNVHFRLGVGTNSPEYTLDVNGYIRGNNVTVPSDFRFKKNFQELQNVLAIIDSLHSYRYFYRIDSFANRAFPDSRQIGLIAQEIEVYFPEIVFTDNKGFKSLDYGRFTAVLLEAIKEQREAFKIFKEDMEARLKKLDDRIIQLEKQSKND